MRFLKQSTSVDLPIGPFVDQTDGFTPEGALTITQPDIRLKKNNGNWAQKNAAQTLTHEENGYYEVTLDATDTDTLGQLRLAVNESGALPVWEEFMIMPANVWDAMFGADKLVVDVGEWLGVAPDALSSGKVAADLKLWLAAAPAALSANGFVQSMLLRWLTDNAGGTPSALIAGRVDANAQVVGDKTGYSLTGAQEDAIVNKVWDELTAEARTAGSFGQKIKDLTVDANGRVKADVERWLGAVVNALIGGRVDVIASVLGLDAVDATAIAASAANEIRDAVFAKVLAELPQAQPSATPDFATAVMLLYMSLRNAGKSTATERRILNDAGTVITKAPMSDDGVTFDQGKLVAGP